MKIHSYTRRRTDIFHYRRWMVGNAEHVRAFDLEAGRQQGQALVAKLRGLDDRDAAAAEVDAPIQVTPDELPALDDGEYFWHQIEGLQVVTLDGVRLGTVDYLLETGANDVLVVTGDRERLIPYVDEVVHDVDLEAGVLRVDWDAGF